VDLLAVVGGEGAEPRVNVGLVLDVILLQRQSGLAMTKE
jgi:hypothetical protein